MVVIVSHVIKLIHLYLFVNQPCRGTSFSLTRVLLTDVELCYRLAVEFTWLWSLFSVALFFKPYSDVSCSCRRLTSNRIIKSSSSMYFS